MGCQMLFEDCQWLRIILFSSLIVRTGGVELEVVLLEVGMAEIALMSV